MPICRETAATAATPCMNLAFRSSSVMSRMAGSNTDPESDTFWTMRPYVKGEILSMLRRVASDIPTLSPAVIRGNVRDNFNCTLGNLGGDAQSLEEGSLLR